MTTITEPPFFTDTISASMTSPLTSLEKMTEMLLGESPKPVPLIVTGNPPFVAPDVGEMAVMDGRYLCINREHLIKILKMHIQSHNG